MALFTELESRETHRLVRDLNTVLVVFFPSWRAENDFCDVSIQSL